MCLFYLFVSVMWIVCQVQRTNVSSSTCKSTLKAILHTCVFPAMACHFRGKRQACKVTCFSFLLQGCKTKLADRPTSLGILSLCKVAMASMLEKKSLFPHPSDMEKHQHSFVAMFLSNSPPLTLVFGLLTASPSYTVR